jgi:tRNA-modifying protein YgfZ
MKTLNVDQSGWGQLRMTGDDRVRFLQGMCTADVAKLPVGGWCRASILNPKGRVISIVDVVKEGDHLLLLCEPVLADKTREILERHALMDEVELEPVALPLHRVWATPADVWAAPPILAPCPAPAASDDEVEVRRIEGGLPRYGVDVSEDHFPFESPLARAIDYEKGCYVGQEPVYRVYSKGSANKTLRGLALEGDTPVAAGAKVAHPARENAGAVTSAAVSPDFGSIALAYLHRTVWEPGGQVTVDGRPARVVELPFGR